MAATTGLTVRVLHHYDTLGLVRPSLRTAAGHRRYRAEDVEQLYRVQALRALGLPLREVAELFSVRLRGDLADIVDRQVTEISGRIERQQELLERLLHLRDRLGAGSGHDTDDLITTIARMTMLHDDLRHDYAEQSARYDLTRGVSPSVFRPMLAALQGAPGRVLYDVGGGTGNYADALRRVGWDPTVVELSPDMRAKAEAKGLRVLAGDATSLPLADTSADALVMISMLHQVPNWRAALDEAARVLRPGGRLAVMVLAADHLKEVTWAFDLFPSARTFALTRRPTLAALTGHLPGTVATPIWFADLADASIGALCAQPEAMLDERLRRQTSFFGRLERDNPAELAQGLARLREMLNRGEDPRAGREAARARLGDATILNWQRSH